MCLNETRFRTGSQDSSAQIPFISFIFGEHALRFRSDLDSINIISFEPLSHWVCFFFSQGVRAWHERCWSLGCGVYSSEQRYVWEYRPSIRIIPRTPSVRNNLKQRKRPCCKKWDYNLARDQERDQKTKYPSSCSTCTIITSTILSGFLPILETKENGPLPTPSGHLIMKVSEP